MSYRFILFISANKALDLSGFSKVEYSTNVEHTHIMKKNTKLKTKLDSLLTKYGRSYLESDPLMFPHRYSSNADREIVGLISAVLAYGQVKIIQTNVGKILRIMGSSPYDFTMNFDPSLAKNKTAFSSFKHRFNDGRDVMALIYYIRQMFESHGSIGAFFTEGYSSDHENIKEALISFTERTLTLSTGGAYGKNIKPPKDSYVRFLFPSPKDGSTCKRLNLYLRWMVRSDSHLTKNDRLDFGLWKDIPPSKLVIPVDTHIARISRNLGLTDKKTTNWRVAEEITERLKALDPKDPVKYDFSLCRLGILDECPSKVDKVKCAKCLIKEVCIL